MRRRSPGFAVLAGCSLAMACTGCGRSGGGYRYPGTNLPSMMARPWTDEAEFVASLADLDEIEPEVAACVGRRVFAEDLELVPYEVEGEPPTTAYGVTKDVVFDATIQCGLDLDELTLPFSD